MESWLLTTLALGLYGLLKEFRPSEPFLTEYLIEEKWANITLGQAYYDVYPVWTYSYLILLVIVFLLTDLLRYKVVIIVEGLAYIATWCLLLWGKGVQMMQVKKQHFAKIKLMQVAYGLATSTEVAYYTYIYAKVSREHYQKVTSFTRVSLLMGRFLAGVAAQILASTQILDYRGLNFVSLASVSLATLVSLTLPKVDKTLYFHRARDIDNGGGTPDGHTSRGELRGVSKTNPFFRIKRDFVMAFRSPYVFKWSLWWALAMCGNFQVGNYIQPLWETIYPSKSKEVDIYNGAVEASTTLVGAGLAFAFGYMRFNWKIIGEPVIFLVAFLNGVVLLQMAITNDIWVAYIGYLAYRALYQFLITVASYEISRNLHDDTYGLVFGINTFMALAFQTALTLVVADDTGLALLPRDQFKVYGGYWIVIGFLFLAIFVANLTRNKHQYIAVYREEGVWLEEEREPTNIPTRAQNQPQSSADIFATQQ